ncbi:MAG: ADP-ribosyl-[dinitrogen reductase] hydrolase [Candidatus Omnitrophota bacterium]
MADQRGRMSTKQRSQDDALLGILLGTAVGDALGLPAEGLSRARIRALGWHPWRHRLVFGRGMISDDTQHTVFVAQAWLESEGEAEIFKRVLLCKLRYWILGGPAGVGFATMKALLKSWVGFPAARCGVFSAGNGPAMRSAILGALVEEDQLAEWIAGNTVITHTDPKAFFGALAVARCVQCRDSPNDIPQKLSALGPEDAVWQDLVALMQKGRENQWDVDTFASAMGCDQQVSGYVYQTVPIAIYAWLHHWGDFEAAITQVLNCGGDTDSVAAITGALAGSVTGVQGIPGPWLNGLCDWPIGTSYLKSLASHLANETSGRHTHFWPGTLLRNIVFTSIVLTHVLLRVTVYPWLRKKT